jgi:hypothetical protein
VTAALGRAAASRGIAGGMGNFFRYLLDTEYSQRRDIEGLRDEVARVAASGPDTEDLRRVHHRIDRLAHEVEVVKAALTVLSQAMVEVGGLDAAELDRRIDAALAARPRPPAETATTVPCGNCGLSYPPERMAGTLCKRCAALAAP